MKMFCALAFVLAGISTLAAPDIQTVRALYSKAPFEEKSCARLLDLLRLTDAKRDPLMAGYKASATMMMAKHVFSPVAKLSHFNKGRRLLDKAIETAPGNIELRLLRYSAQVYAPSFLGYRKNIREDHAFLIKHRSTVKDRVLAAMIEDVLNKKQ